jgi:alpha-beta hydrolase superfamily lysophospholipase
VGQDIKLTASDNFQLGGYRAEPASTPKAAVVVIQEIFGVNHHIRAICDRFAGNGYVAIAPAIFDRIEPNFQSGYSPEEVAVARKFVANPDWTAMLRDSQAAIDAVKDVGPVGIIGFCLGGSVAYAAATKLSGLCPRRSAIMAVPSSASPTTRRRCRPSFISVKRMRAFRSATSISFAPSGPTSRFTSIPGRSTASTAMNGRVMIRRTPASPNSAASTSWPGI